MNALGIGLNKTQLLHFVPNDNYLVIDSGPFIELLAQSNRTFRTLDIYKDSINPVLGIDEDGAEQLSEIIYEASPYGTGTLRVRDGKRALKTLVLEAPRLDKLRYTDSDEDQEARGAVNDILFSPIRRRFLCGTAPISLSGSMVVKLDPKLSDRTRLIIAWLLIANFKGTIVIPDFGFYGRAFHSYLIWQNRLVAGLNYLDESPLKDALLLIKDNGADRCTYKDAVKLAEIAGLHPDPTKIDNDYNKFIKEAVEGQG